MKIILTREVSNLGSPGDIVEVKNGYARNYLLPQGHAIAWTKGAEKQVVTIKRAQEAREIRSLDHANEIKASLAAVQVRLIARAGTGGRLFGSVTPAEIVEAVKKAGGPAVDRRRLEIANPIKALGTHLVSVKLHPEVTATFKLEVNSAK
ncbi:50S ribosomal protein L9 [Actinorhabdospora filicis]|uniref:Large ribosomal subunit protein bL9 n=1 Tax=Actinorhabdospora filicis TaxID=1785913 RepID=A0A9W6W9I7_9ACTN|nr:50S ribosomal protein L9 [Actinorhabdospora filicis]GLZ77586.1 50S ribosomal protein L9 [Actinorhabdospora filicis]